MAKAAIDTTALSNHARSAKLLGFPEGLWIAGKLLPEISAAAANADTSLLHSLAVSARSAVLVVDTDTLEHRVPKYPEHWLSSQASRWNLVRADPLTP
jgi:hypothetical protein